MKYLQEHQIRVVVELEELVKKSTSLVTFLSNDEKTATLAEEEFNMLREQFIVMSEYEKILIKRIEYFVKNCPERDS